MSVKVDASGRRSVQSQTEVPGTPEQVWQAIATGPGVSSWFVPCQIEERVGGKITVSFGPGMESSSTVTSWEAPHRFSAEGSEMSPGSPVMATEWTVEAKSGGTCLVRVVHSWFAETDQWDSQFEGTETGWTAFFRDLELYLMHFSGQPSHTFQLMAMSAQSQEAAWAKLTDALALSGKGVGAVVESPAGSPGLSGEVKHVGSNEHPEAVVLLTEPGAGIGHFFAMPMAGMICLSIRVFIFGTASAGIVAREEAVWSAWTSETFPMPTPAEA
ncbi:MAG TPA: SRPBCC domain-containing protein [Fimbriimonas sp.]|nr:SRPBCC domain-containing protein [Fimbriimonas sp.]